MTEKANTRKVAEKIAENHTALCWRKSLADAIDKALTDERERCARVAEMVDRRATFADDEILRARIAAAIRNPEEEGVKEDV